MNNIMFHVRAAAERGEANSQFNLGVFYDNGLDDNGHAARRNRREAIKWLRKAAQQGLTRAQCKLAEIYAEESAPDQAYAWFFVAGENSDGGNGQSAQAGLKRMAARLSPEQIDRATRRARGWAARIAKHPL